VLAAYGEKVKSFEMQVANLQTTRDMAVNAAAAYVEMAKQKVLSGRAAVDSAGANVRAAQFQYDRSKALLADGIVSRRDYELAERDLEVARQSSQSADAALSGAASDLDGQKANLDKTRADAESKVNAAVGYLNEARGQAEDARVKLATLEVTLARQQSRVVTAPRAGTGVPGAGERRAGRR
jgi:multidrug resistance efflux pump